MLYFRRLYDGTVLKDETQLYYMPGYYSDGLPVSGVGVVDYVAHGRSIWARRWQYGSCAALLALSLYVSGQTLEVRPLYVAVSALSAVLWLTALYCDYIAGRSRVAFILLRLTVVGCSTVMVAGLLIDPVLIEYWRQVDPSSSSPLLRWLFIIAILVLSVWVVLRFLQDRKIAHYSRQRIDESDSWLQLVRAVSIIAGYGRRLLAARMIDRLESVRGEELSRLLDLYFAEALPLERRLAACTDQEARRVLFDQLVACAEQYAKSIDPLL